MGTIKLGEEALYPDTYDAGLLRPIARAQSRASLGLTASLPFVGQDIWTAYELSWLMPGGKPVAAIAEFRFSAHSEAIVESKSLKYYLNSFNQSVFSDMQTVQATLIKDLSQASGAPVDIRCDSIDTFPRRVESLPGVCVDDLDIPIHSYQPDASLLAFGNHPVEQDSLYSHLLKSNCPVTGQPDWASVWVCYSGLQLLPESWLQYVVSFRQHQDFHENCVEKMFCDLLASGHISSLAVYARYTRRGGLDINPYRATPDLGAELPERIATLKTGRQ